MNPVTNRITDPGYGYDANGNMTGDGLNTLIYDGENRAVTSASGGTTSTYTYDGNNLRVNKQVGGGTVTVYLFSGTKVIAEYAAGANPNSPAKEYIYTGGQLLATIVGSTTTYHHADHLSARVNTDTNGNVAGQQGHYPYGESWFATNTTTKWQFTTYERDGGVNESGDDYAMMRYHVNRLGRFSSPDPVSGSPANPQSLNLYAYVRNDPVNATDPSGAFPIGMRPMFDIPPPPSSGVIWGNTIFDAIHGSPGTWLDFDMHGNLQWGFSIDLWQSQMAAQDQAGKLKDALKELLGNEDCAKWLGGQDRASAILGEFAGVFDVSPGSDWIPRNPRQMRAQQTINSDKAIAMNDSLPGLSGAWNGRPFAVFAGAVFNQQSQPAQLTVVIHELAHVAWKGTPMGEFIDINNGLSSAFWISRDCGTAVPEWDKWKVPR